MCLVFKLPPAAIYVLSLLLCTLVFMIYFYFYLANYL